MFCLLSSGEIENLVLLISLFNSPGLRFNSAVFLSLSFFKNIYTYHSLKFDDSVLWLVVWCTAEAAGDMELLLWFSVDGDTMVGGVEDSYPELAAGDGCGPGLVDSCTFNSKKKTFVKMLSCMLFDPVFVFFVQIQT